MLVNSFKELESICESWLPLKAAWLTLYNWMRRGCSESLQLSPHSKDKCSLGFLFSWIQRCSAAPPPQISIQIMPDPIHANQAASVWGTKDQNSSRGVGHHEHLLPEEGTAFIDGRNKPLQLACVPLPAHMIKWSVDESSTKPWDTRKYSNSYKLHIKALFRSKCNRL